MRCVWYGTAYVQQSESCLMCPTEKLIITNMISHMEWSKRISVCLCLTNWTESKMSAGLLGFISVIHLSSKNNPLTLEFSYWANCAWGEIQVNEPLFWSHLIPSRNGFSEKDTLLCGYWFWIAHSSCMASWHRNPIFSKNHLRIRNFTANFASIIIPRFP